MFFVKVRPYGMSITTAFHWMSMYFILHVRDGVLNAVKLDDYFISIYVLCLSLALFFEFFMPKTHVGSFNRMIYTDVDRLRSSKLAIDP